MEKGEREIFKSTALTIGSRRCQVDIIVDILNTSCRGIKKTELMHRCNMSFPQIERYLDSMLRAKLLSAQNKAGYIHFKTSDKGKAFLKNYGGLKTLLARKK